MSRHTGARRNTTDKHYGPLLAFLLVYVDRHSGEQEVTDVKITGFPMALVTRKAPSRRTHTRTDED